MRLCGAEWYVNGAAPVSPELVWMCGVNPRSGIALTLYTRIVNIPGDYHMNVSLFYAVLFYPAPECHCSFLFARYP